MSFATCCLDVFRNQQQKYKGIRIAFRLSPHRSAWSSRWCQGSGETSSFGCLKIGAKSDPDWFLQLFRVTSIGHLVSAHLPGRCERWRIHHDGRQVGWAILFGPTYVGDAVEVVHVHRFRNGWTVDAFAMFSWRRSDPTLPCRSIKLDCWQNKCV